MAKNRTRTYPHRDVTICLDGERGGERDDLLGKKREGGRLTPDEAKRLKQLEAEMRDSLLTVRIPGVPRSEYLKIQRAHPAKNPIQAFDPDTFFYDFAYKKGFEVDGEEVTPLSEWKRAEWDDITEGLTEGEWNDLAQAVHDMNVKRLDTGFLSRGSGATEPSSPSSEQPEPGE